MVAFYLPAGSPPAGSPPPPSTIPDYPFPPPPSLEPAAVTSSPPHLSPQTHSGNMVASCLDMLSHHPALYHLHYVSMCAVQYKTKCCILQSSIHRISSPLSKWDTSSIHLIIDTHFYSNFILHYLVQLVVMTTVMCSVFKCLQLTLDQVKLPFLPMRIAKPSWASSQISRQECATSCSRMELILSRFGYLSQTNSLLETAFLHLRPVWQKCSRPSPNMASGTIFIILHLWELLEGLVVTILRWRGGFKPTSKTWRLTM